MDCHSECSEESKDLCTTGATIFRFFVAAFLRMTGEGLLPRSSRGVNSSSLQSAVAARPRNDDSVVVMLLIILWVQGVAAGTDTDVDVNVLVVFIFVVLGDGHEY